MDNFLNLIGPPNTVSILPLSHADSDCALKTSLVISMSKKGNPLIRLVTSNTAEIPPDTGVRKFSCKTVFDLIKLY